MQEKEISEVLLKNTELNVINSGLQKQLDEMDKVRALLPNTVVYCLDILKVCVFNTVFENLGLSWKHMALMNAL